jgi:hypothetical protein
MTMSIMTLTIINNTQDNDAEYNDTHYGILSKMTMSITELLATLSTGITHCKINYMKQNQRYSNTTTLSMTKIRIVTLCLMPIGIMNLIVTFSTKAVNI